MNIPREFEDVFHGVYLTEDEIRTLNWITGWEHRTVENLRSAIQKAQATALSTLQAENEKLRAEADGMRSNWYKAVEEIKNLRAELDEKEKYYDQMIDALSATDSAELERVKRERDAAVKVIERVRSCKDCGHYTGEWTPPCKECQDSEEHHPYFKWHGQKED